MAQALKELVQTEKVRLELFKEAQKMQKEAQDIQKETQKDWVGLATKKLLDMEPDYSVYQVMSRFWTYHIGDARCFVEVPARFQESLLQDQLAIAKKDTSSGEQQA